MRMLLSRRSFNLVLPVYRDVSPGRLEDVRGAAVEIVSLSISEHTVRQTKVSVCSVGVFVYVKQVIRPCNRPWLICFRNPQSRDKIMSHMVISVDGVS